MNKQNKILNQELWHLLGLTSRTFFLSIRQLPGQAGNAMCLAYLLLRVSDYLEDNQIMSPNEKHDALKNWHQVIIGCENVEKMTSALPPEDNIDNSDWVAAKSAGKILQALLTIPGSLQDYIIHHVSDSTLGMARWVKRGPVFYDENDMDDYMHEVAGRVGYLSTEIFAWQYPSVRQKLPTLMPMARETGLALQTVNIIRGMRKDYERGWIFVPETFCKTFDITRESLFEPQYQSQAMQVVDLLIGKAQKHLDKAEEYIQILPPWLHRLRLACIWPMLFATRTLAVSHRNLAVLLGEVKITRKEVRRIILDTSILGWSNTWLSSYAQRLQQP
jgi:farnesyl-diphosphate farnesyltransferase